MVIKCPRCNSEFDLELDDVVVEMLFSCPNCKARFLVRNSDSANVSLVDSEAKEDDSRFQPAPAATPPAPVAPPPSPVAPPSASATPSPAPVSPSTPPVATPPKKPAEKRKPAPNAKSSKRYVWMALALVLLLVVGALAMRSLRGDSAEPLLGDTSLLADRECTNVILALDISTSMLAEDLQPNRIEAVKAVLGDEQTPWQSDSVGLVLFAGQVVEQCPLTDQRPLLNRRLQDVDLGMVKRGDIEDGTAIGMGLACAVARLRQSSAQRKVVVLFTDGSNNRGEVSPSTATELARLFGVQVFTVAVGTTGVARYPLEVGGKTQYVNLPVEIDTLALKDIAAATGGRFYRAGNKNRLRAICRDIGQQLGRQPVAVKGEPSGGQQMDEASATRLLNMVVRHEQNTRKRLRNK